MAHAASHPSRIAARGDLRVGHAAIFLLRIGIAVCFGAIAFTIARAPC